MSNIINSFRGENYFLSNFYPASVTYDGITYTNSEAAFQAQKCADKADRATFAGLNPSEAKKKGRRVSLRKDWEQVKRNIMYDIVKAKFTQNPVLRLKLQATGKAHLEEGNTWGDRTWGTVNGVGQNWLGKLLMQVRTELHKDNELIVLERKNGWYGGYVAADDGIRQVFNSNKNDLFNSTKWYTDRGYTVTCLDRSCEEEFMEGRTTIQQVLESREMAVIWRYATASPFRMGGPAKKPIATTIRLDDYKVVTLHKDYIGIVVEGGQAAGVYELNSGGLVGDTVEQVNADIDECEDRSVMDKQIAAAADIRNMAVTVSNAEFGLESR